MNSARVDVVLVRPENPANIGAAARAMRNTGLGRLVLVAPAPFRTVECWRSAWGAQDVLEDLEELPDLGAALGRYEHLAAFTGRPSPDQAAADVREVADRFAALPAAASAAFVFGAETAGLSEEELRLCGIRVQIPTHPDQPSINLSHAVLVAGYEWLRASSEGVLASRHASSSASPRSADRALARVRSGSGSRAREADQSSALEEHGLVSRADREAFLATWRDALVGAGALAEDDTRYFQRWEDFIRRTALSPRDLRLFVHLARKLKHR